MAKLWMLIAAASIAWVVPSQAFAQSRKPFLPNPASVAAPDEQQFIPDILWVMQHGENNPDEALQRTNIALAEINKPTQMRGIFLLLKARALKKLDRDVEAIVAADASVELLPGYAGPALFAANLYAYTDNADRAVDYIVRLHSYNPTNVNLIDDYKVGAILSRMNTNTPKGRRKIAELANVLLKGEWIKGSMTNRSTLARYAIDAALDDKDVAAAKAMVPYLARPDDSYALLAERKYADLWPSIEEWAGPRLEKQWTLYLTNTRARWVSSGNTDDLRHYASALREAGASSLLISEVAPALSDEIDKAGNDGLVFSVAPTAAAFAMENRWDDAFALMDRAGKRWPNDKHANALNIGFNVARLLEEQGKAAQAVAAFDRSKRSAQKFGGHVSSNVFAQVERHRVCALHKLGRNAEVSSAQLYTMKLSAYNQVAMQLCLDNPDAAKENLLRDLSISARRSSAISAMQPDTSGWYVGSIPYERAQALKALQSDPALLAALKPVGRVLPFTSNEGARSAIAALERQQRR